MLKKSCTLPVTVIAEIALFVDVGVCGNLSVCQLYRLHLEFGVFEKLNGSICLHAFNSILFKRRLEATDSTFFIIII